MSTLSNGSVSRKQVLDFQSLSKLYATHPGYEILAKSLVLLRIRYTLEFSTFLGPDGTRFSPWTFQGLNKLLAVDRDTNRTRTLLAVLMYTLCTSTLLTMGTLHVHIAGGTLLVM
jgi:hypothetical protein